MAGYRITRRNAGKLLIAAGLATGSAQAARPTKSRLRIERATIEWQVGPMALDKVQPRLHWSLRAGDPKVRNLRQTAHRTRILTAIGRKAVYDSGWINGTQQTFQPKGPLPLLSQTPYLWQLEVRDQDGLAAPAYEHRFATGILTPGDRMAQWIAGEGDADDRYRAIEGRAVPQDRPEPLPVFRKTFTSADRPVFAHLAVIGLGQYQLWLNGRQVPPPGLNGGWTDFDRRVLYDSYDVTGIIGTGTQTIGVALGNGFFNVEAVKGRYAKLNGRFGQPQLWLQLTLHYRNGRHETVVSDGSWQTRNGGTTYSSIFGGEDFDARRDDGRFRAEEDWRPAATVAGPRGTLQAASFSPAVDTTTYTPKAIRKLGATTRVVDFGVNHAGRPRIQLANMSPGAVVRLIPAELTDVDGSVDQASMTGGGKPGLRGIHFTYVCRGGAGETWRPQFTYTGYRYLQIEGVEDQHLASVDSTAVQAGLNVGGSFACSDSAMEAIHGLIRRALVSNTVSVSTDCPTREKLGWLEQTYLNAATVMNNLDAARLYEKIALDIVDAQGSDGMVPSIVPEYIRFLDKDGKSTRFRDTPEWGAAVVLAPWYVYQRFGDMQILRDSYDAMAAYMDYLETRAGLDGLLDFGLGDWFDIGPKKPGAAQLTTRKMTGTATWYAQLVTLAKISRLLGRTGSYAERAQALKGTLQRQLYHAETATFDTGSQTAQAMALVLDLFPAESRSKALEGLIADIRSRNNQITAGDIGFHYLVRALSDSDRADVLYDMLSRKEGPSYLNQIASGATALTEAWDASRNSSQNHFMLGHAEIWFFHGLGGVTVDFAAEDGVPLILAPQLVAGIERTAVESVTVVGRVSCSVSDQGNQRLAVVEVPAGQCARLRLPFAPDADVRESGVDISRATGVLRQTIDGDARWVTLGSGIYRFTSSY